ncbi:MAG: hypothetical protein JXQ93_11165 [Flavobacteriaceae bacterium]
MLEYVYQYKDHLGNVRLSYTDADNNGSINAATEIIEESNYYPFGLKHKGYNNVVSSNGNSVAQKKKFQGQELEEELGKNTYAYQWRDYDPAIGRFFKIDRFAEKYQSITPYHFAANNPIFFKEIKGDSIEGVSRKSARRAKRIIRRTFKKNKKIARLFKKRGKKFKGISQKDFDEATKGASDDVVALAKGYFNAVNSSSKHSVEIVKRGEKVKSLKTRSGTNPDASQFDTDTGGGNNIRWRNGNSHSVIVMNSTATVPDYRDNSTGSMFSRSSSAGELLAHELIGHGMLDARLPSTTQNNAIQMSNLYLRVAAKSSSYRFYRDGSGHGSGVTIPGTMSWNIPSSLK